MSGSILIEDAGVIRELCCLEAFLDHGLGTIEVHDGAADGFMSGSRSSHAAPRQTSIRQRRRHRRRERRGRRSNTAFIHSSSAGLVGQAGCKKLKGGLVGCFGPVASHAPSLRRRRSKRRPSHARIGSRITKGARIATTTVMLGGVCLYRIGSAISASNRSAGESGAIPSRDCQRHVRRHAWLRHRCHASHRSHTAG